MIRINRIAENQYYSKPQFQGLGTLAPEPPSLKATFLACDEIEKRSPQWYQAAELAQAALAYLKSFFAQQFSGQKASFGPLSSIIALPVDPQAAMLQFLKASLLTTDAAMEQASLRALYTQIQGQPEAEKAKVLQQEILKDPETMKSFIQSLYQLTKAPPAGMVVVMAKGAPLQSPRWYEQWGLATAIATYWNQLETALKRHSYLAHLPKDKLLGPREYGRVVQAGQLHPLLAAKQTLDTLRCDSRLSDIVTAKFEEQIPLLYERIEVDPKSYEALGNQLFEAVKQISWIVAQDNQ